MPIHRFIRDKLVWHFGILTQPGYRYDFTGKILCVNSVALRWVLSSRIILFQILITISIASSGIPDWNWEFCLSFLYLAYYYLGVGQL